MTNKINDLKQWEFRYELLGRKTSTIKTLKLLKIKKEKKDWPVGMQQMGREEKLVIFFSTDVYHQNCSKKSVHVHVCMFVCVCKHACID